MIVLNRSIHSQAVIPHLEAADKFEAIHKLVDKLMVCYPSLLTRCSRETICTQILARENMQTTGIGQRLAFPHARIEWWGEFVMVLGVSQKGIDFQNPDKISARLIGLMVSLPGESVCYSSVHDRDGTFFT